MTVLLTESSPKKTSKLKIAVIAVIGWGALFVIPNPFIVKDRDKGAAVVTAGAKTVGGLLVEAAGNLKDRFMTNYTAPSSQKDGDVTSAKLAKAFTALAEALKDSKNSAE